MEHRECAVCGTLLLFHEHIGMPVGQDKLTGALIMGNEICTGCLKKYLRSKLVDKAMRKLIKADKTISRKCTMVYNASNGKGIEILVLDKLPRNIRELFNSKPNNLPFAFD